MSVRRRRPIRVSFLIDNLSRAGTESQMLALVRSLDRAEFAPSIALLDGSAAESRELEPADCPVLRLGLRSFRHVPSALAASAKLVRFWRGERVDVVQTYFIDSTYFGVPLARVAGVRRVVRVRNNVGHWVTPLHQTLGAFVGRLAHATLTNSEPGREALRKHERLPRRKLAVLENGVDLERFDHVAPPRFGRDARTVGVVANLRPVKGVECFVRAAAAMAARFPALRFLIAGDGEQRAALESLAAELGVGGRVLFLGRLTNVERFLSEVDLAVLPSRAEGMSNALLEYMAAGRPIVATQVGANPRLLGHGERGRLVPPEDAAGLAAAIAQLIEDAPLARRLAQAARAHVRAEWGRDGMRRRFEDFYRRLCA